MQIKVFGKPNCEYCKTTMQKFETFMKRWNVAPEAIKLNFFDMEGLDGLAEGAFYGVTKIPTTIIEKNESLVARWDGKVPLSEEFKSFFGDLAPQSEKDIN